MPVYNAESTVSEALRSLLDQSYQRLEIIVIDDGSTDRSLECLRSFRDDRIKIFPNEKNLGIVASLNRGLSEAKGDFIARMDADDFSLPLRIEKQVEFMLKYPDVGVLGTAYRCFDASGPGETVLHPTSQGEIITDFLLGRSVIAHPTVLMRASVIRDHGILYRAQAQYCEDYDLWLQLAQHAKFANLPEVLLHYRKSSSSLSHVFQARQSDLREKTRIAFLRLGMTGLSDRWELPPNVFSSIVTAAVRRRELELSFASLRQVFKSGVRKLAGLLKHRSSHRDPR